MSKVEIIRLNSARNALRYLLKAYKIPKICVPYYICPRFRSLRVFGKHPAGDDRRQDHKRDPL